MDFVKTVAKGIVVSFILHLVFATLMVKMDFNISMANFSVLLVLLVAIISFYVGVSSKKQGAVAGVVVALGTAGILLLYLNQRIEMNWELNRYIIAIYLLVGFVFSFLGSIMFRKKQPKKTMEIRKEELRKKQELRKRSEVKKGRRA